jgi:hypothetical protein
MSHLRGRISSSGQEKAAAGSGTTGKVFDAPARRKSAALRVELERPPAALRRLADVPHRPARRAWRIDSPQFDADGSFQLT